MSSDITHPAASAGLHPTLRAYFDAIDALSASDWSRCFAEDGETEDPVGSPPIRGRAALEAFFTAIAALFEHVHFTADAAYPCGDSIAVSWSARGRGRNGRWVAFAGIDVFELDRTGLIRRVRAWWDPAPVLAALGASA